MKFNCDKKELASACATVARAAAKKANIPALEGIKVTVTEDSTQLCGYNLEIGIVTECKTTGYNEAGTAVLDAKTLCNIVKHLPNGDVEFSSDSAGNTTIKGGDAQFSIVGMKSGEYPELPAFDEKNSVKVPQAILKDMIRQTIFAVSDNMSGKPIYTGAQFKFSDGELSVTGVDGYRVALCTESIDYSGSPIDFVVPKLTLIEVQNLLSDKDGDAKISIGARHAAFTIGDFIVYTRLLEGDYMDVNAAIPKDYTTEATVSTSQMAESVERTSLIVTDKLMSPLKLNIGSAAKDGNINLSCGTALGKASDVLPASITGSGDMDIGFNSSYLLDALHNAECDEVKLQFSGALSPLVVKPCEGNSFLFMVLPVRLKTDS